MDHPEPNVQPRSTEEARRAVQESRDRISRDLDAIENRIEYRTDQLKRRADVLRPVRERVEDRPWPVVGAALGAGVVLGLLTGGRDGEREHRRARHRVDDREYDEFRRWKEERQQEARRRGERQGLAGFRAMAAERLRRNGPRLVRTIAPALTGAVIARGQQMMDNRRAARTRHTEPSHRELGYSEPRA
jgi:ElaB/YqjD/DUF883 family membrane-anchored ribosome-binding protein